MRIRDASQGYQTAKKYGKKDSPWMAYEDEMAKKTAVRALSKYLPLSVEFMDAVQIDETSADYRGFALDPTQGVAMGDEPDEIEEAEIEADPVVENTTRAEVKAEPKKQAQKADEMPAASTEWHGLVSRIAGDLLDGAKADDLRETFADQIAQMKAEAPEMHANLEAEFAAHAE